MLLLNVSRTLTAEKIVKRHRGINMRLAGEHHINVLFCVIRKRVMGAIPNLHQACMIVIEVHTCSGWLTC